MNKKIIIASLLSITLLSASKSFADDQKYEGNKPDIKCHLKFSSKGWSAFYKTSKGTGKITCDNGNSARVAIKATGGGVTFGKTKITNGRGTFSAVKNISELYGSYATSEAHAGVVDSGTAQALTKGNVSLALTGTGKGVDVGIAFGSFKITPLK